MEKKVKIADYSEEKLRSRLNFFYALTHGTGMTAAILGLVGLINNKQQTFSLICVFVGLVYLALSAVFQNRYLACRNELQQRKNNEQT